MSPESEHSTERSQPFVAEIKAIMNDPDNYELAGTVHNWPSHPQLDKLPETFHAQYVDAGKSFLIIRDNEEYIHLPQGMLIDKIDELNDTSQLSSAYPRLTNIDLPNYDIRGVNLADVAGALIDER
jgi:hypothetical protein